MKFSGMRIGGEAVWLVSTTQQFIIMAARAGAMSCKRHQQPFSQNYSSLLKSDSVFT